MTLRIVRLARSTALEMHPCLALIKAVDFKRWDDAIRLLQNASADHPNEGDTILIYGLRYEVYVPHYFLGVALFNTGDCDAALAQLAESERQGAIRRSPEYKNVQRYKEACQKHIQ